MNVILNSNGKLIARSGEQTLFIISINTGSRFFIRGTALLHDSAAHDLCQIYVFDSRSDAETCLNQINSALTSSPPLRTGIPLSPIHVIMFLCMALAVAIILFGQQHFSIKQYENNIKKTEFNTIKNEKTITGDASPQQHTTMTTEPEFNIKTDEKNINPDAVATERDPPEEKRAASLQKAANNGTYTVTLSSGHARTIFVFADPLCPYCRELEPTLEALTRDYNIEIFPVTVIGDDDSLSAVLPIMCATPDKRALLWLTMMRQPNNTQHSSCEGSPAQQAISINNRAFNYYGFQGTPTILADNGKEIPVSALASDTALASFMDVNQ